MGVVGRATVVKVVVKIVVTAGRLCCTASSSRTRATTYASLSRRAGADLRLLQKAMGHASITVTAHTYADLFDDELDNIAVALDSLSDF